MKKLLLAVLLLGFSQFLVAQDYGLHWKYKDYPGSITFSVSDPFIHMGTWFLEEKPERKLARKVNKVRVMVFDGYSPVSEKDLRKFGKKASKRSLEDLVMVRDGKTRVRVMVKEKKEAIRKVVVLVQEPSMFVLATVKGKIRYRDINAFLEAMDKDFEIPEFRDLPQMAPPREVIRM